MFFSSKSTQNTTLQTTNVADSYNATLAPTEVLSEVGNTTLNVQSGIQPEKFLPLLAVLFLAAGLFMLWKNR